MEILFFVLFDVFVYVFVVLLKEDSCSIERRSTEREQSTAERSLLRPCSRNLEASGHLLRPVNTPDTTKTLLRPVEK